MAHIDHGSWTRYIPPVLPKDAPAGAMFVKREGDHQDWYDYVDLDDSFQTDTVKFAARWIEEHGKYLVGPVVYDVTMLFPDGHIVVEIPDYTGDDAFADLNGKLYDPETDSFSDLPPPPATRGLNESIVDILDKILNRLDKLEAKR
jgi:hypothetical protein